MNSNAPIPRPAELEQKYLTELEQQYGKCNSALSTLMPHQRPATLDEIASVSSHLLECEQYFQTYQPTAPFLS
ncbi:MAG: hypothetical protein HY268_32820 [Deltaproteobacteria bacterium]|nr:hypothetical protein [Deltaproteobacteria bacterium]